MANVLLAGWLFLREDKPAVVPVSKVQEQRWSEELRLLDELASERLQEMLATHERLKLQEVVEGEVGKPLYLGWRFFEELADAEDFVERLSVLEVEGQVTQVEVPGEAGYWVYLAPAMSKREALRLLHELQAKWDNLCYSQGDSWLIPIGSRVAKGIRL